MLPFYSGYSFCLAVSTGVIVNPLPKENNMITKLKTTFDQDKNTYALIAQFAVLLGVLTGVLAIIGQFR